MSEGARPYHHGDLRRALLANALVEIGMSGPAGLSMRELSRRAQVSHAAAAHHFGDKAGVFTAIATEGFGLLAEANGAVGEPPDELFQMALGYIDFAVTHRAHFEVMWRPELYRAEDAALVKARERAFTVFYEAVSTGLGPGDGDLSTTAIAAWSLVHGFASLWLSGNLPTDLGDDHVAAARSIAAGVIALGKITDRQLPRG